MEVLPEQDSPISSFLQTSHITHPPALPPIQSQTIPLPQTWPDTSYDSAWGRQAQQAPQPPSNLPAVVLGIPQFSQSPMIPTTFTSAPPLSSTSSGTTSISPTLHTFPDQQKTRPMEPQQSFPRSHTGMSPYKLSRDLPLPLSRVASERQSSHYSGAKEGSIFQEGEGSLRDLSLRSRKSSASPIETGDRQSVRGQRQSEESMKDMQGRGSQGSTVGEKPSTTPLQTASPVLRDSPTRNMSTESFTGEVRPPHQSPQS